MELSQQDINEFWRMVEGCSKHMTYRGKEAPKHTCDVCERIYSMRREFGRRYPKVVITPYWEGAASPFCMYCDKGEQHTRTAHFREVGQVNR